MLWKSGSLLMLAGAAILISNFSYGTNNDNGLPQVEMSEFVGQRLQRNAEANLDSNLVTVAFEEDADSQDFDVVNSLRQKPAKDSATAVTTEDSSMNMAEEEASTAFVASQTDQDYAPSPWQTNPLSEQSIIEYAATDNGEAYQVPSTPSEPTSILDSTPSVQKRITPIRFAISEAVAHKAIHHIEYGKSLSRRSASFAARQEYLQALSLIAQAIDSQDGQNNYSRALNKAMVAIREAEDFFGGNSESQIGMNAASVLESHRSQIVSPEEARNMTVLQMIQTYFAYAETQLAIAGGQNVVSAEALYSLGKLHSVMSKHDPNPDQLDMAKAIMFHRAALANDPNSYRSANELGALFARNGQMDEAKTMLKKSLMVRQTPQAWNNLAVVHERLGERQLAELAKTEFAITVQNPNSQSAANLIQWVSPQQFDTGIPMDYHESTAQLPDVPTNPPAGAKGNPDSPRWMNKIKKLF